MKLRVNRLEKVKEIVKQHFGKGVKFCIKGNERGNGRPDAWIWIKGVPKLVEVKDWYDTTKPNQKEWSDNYFEAHGEYPLILYRTIKGQTILFDSYLDYDKARPNFMRNHRATDQEIEYIMMHVEDGAEAIAKALGRSAYSVHGLARWNGRGIKIRSIHDWKAKEDETLDKFAAKGKSITEASKQLNRDRHTIRRRAKLLGIEFNGGRTGPIPLKVNVEKIRHLYLEEKLSVPKISKRLGVSYPVIYNRLRESGISFRVGANQFSYAQ